MNQPPIARVVACSTALGAFAVAIVVGMAVDNPTETILLRAIIALVVCYVGGSIVGAVAERTVAHAAAAHKAANPVPSTDHPHAVSAPVASRPPATQAA